MALAAEFKVSQTHIENLAAGASRRHDGWPAGITQEQAPQLWAAATKGSRRKARPGAATLTPDEVTLIRERATRGESLGSLAIAHGVSPGHISAIVRGVSRRYGGSYHLLAPARADRRVKLRDAEVAAIVRRFHAGENRKRLAAEFGVSMSYVYMLARGQKRRGTQRPDSG